MKRPVTLPVNTRDLRRYVASQLECEANAHSPIEPLRRESERIQVTRRTATDRNPTLPPIAA